MTAWSHRLGQLFATYRGQVEAFVKRRTGDPQVAADLTQESFLRFARLGAAKIDNPRSFLFTIAGNLAQDHNRRAARWRRLDGGTADLDHPSPEPDAETVIAGRERMMQLREVIAGLPEKTRAIFVLFHVDGLSYREISERLDVTPRSVEYHLFRAMQECRAKLVRDMPRPDGRS